jgi:hypothetical protein
MGSGSVTVPGPGLLHESLVPVFCPTDSQSEALLVVHRKQWVAVHCYRVATIGQELVCLATGIVTII